MAAKKFAVPNWAQALIARGIGLDPNEIVVRHEDDQSISFLQHMPRQEYIVSKCDGEVTKC